MNLTSSQYSIIVIVFFVTYVLFEVPSNMVLTRVRPSLYLPGLGILWGIFAALMGSAQNWSQVTGLRLLLGFAEVRTASFIRVTFFITFVDKSLFKGRFRARLCFLPVFLVSQI